MRTFKLIRSPVGHIDAHSQTWAIWEDSGNYFTPNTLTTYHGYPDNLYIYNYTTNMSLEAILESGCWEEQPLSSPLPWFTCAECDEVSFMDYLCSDCRC